MAKQKQTKIIPLPSARYNAALDREKNTVGLKLAKLRKERGYTLTELAEQLAAYGVTVQRAGVSKWENGETVPSIYQLMAVCCALDVEEGPSYFMNLPALSPKLNELGLQKLKDYQQDLIASGRYVPEQEESAEVACLSMPVSRLPVSAGTGAFLSDEDFEQMDVPSHTVPEGADFGVIVSGDSMEPVYHDGQIVWVQRCQELRPGEVGIFMYDGNGYIKVYSEQEPSENLQEEFTDSCGQMRMQPVLVSYNSAYPPKAVSPMAEFCIAGRVLK